MTNAWCCQQGGNQVPGANIKKMALPLTLEQLISFLSIYINFYRAASCHRLMTITTNVPVPTPETRRQPRAEQSGFVFPCPLRLVLLPPASLLLSSCRRSPPEATAISWWPSRWRMAAPSHLSRCWHLPKESMSWPGCWLVIRSPARRGPGPRSC